MLHLAFTQVLQFFFAAGRHWQLSTLQFECAFVGFEDFNWTAGFVLMVLHTFAAPLFVILSVPMFISGPTDYFLAAFLRIKVFFSWHLILTVAFVYMERRHLMVWRVFAPKFLMESAFVLFVDLALLLLSVLLTITHQYSSNTFQ